MARSRKGASKGYGWDRIVGGLGLLFTVLALLLIGAFAYLVSKDPKANAETIKQLAALKVAGGLPKMGALVAASALVHLIVSLGILRSRKMAFMLGAFLAGYQIGMGGYWHGGFLLAYTVLRLGQVFGPALR